MAIGTLVVLALLLVTVVYAVQIYNALVRLKHNVARAWSNIDVSLKQRHDELPKLVEVCKQYMGYERETLDRVVRARGSVAEASRRQDMRALGAAETDLRAGESNDAIRPGWSNGPLLSGESKAAGSATCGTAMIPCAR